MARNECQDGVCDDVGHRERRAFWLQGERSCSPPPGVKGLASRRTSDEGDAWRARSYWERRSRNLDLCGLRWHLGAMDQGDASLDFSAFYYSSERGEEIDTEPHFTKYQKDDRINKAEFKDSPYSSKITSDYLKGVIK